MPFTDDNMEIKGADKRFLLDLARKAIEYYLSTGKKLELGPDEVPSEEMIEDGACFVTLYENKELRGCIGSLEAHRPLFVDVIENAIASAVGDPRFPPLTVSELEAVKISISVLTKPEELEIKTATDLLEKLVPGKHGLIIQKGVARATFLPAVWKQIPEKTEFLRHLSMKAGLLPDEWKEQGMKFYIYETIEFSE